jgi:hypothetical protein
MRKALGVIGSLVGVTIAGAALGTTSAHAGPAPQAGRDAAAAVQESIVRSGQDSGVVTELAGGWDRCPVGYFCLLDGYDGAGTMAYFRRLTEPRSAAHRQDREPPSGIAARGASSSTRVTTTPAATTAVNRPTAAGTSITGVATTSSPLSAPGLGEGVSASQYHFRECRTQGHDH